MKFCYSNAAWWYTVSGVDGVEEEVRIEIDEIEFYVRWYKLGGRHLSAKLEMFDDTWTHFTNKKFLGLLAAIAMVQKGTTHFFPESLCELLRTRGFEDTTPYEWPDEPWARQKRCQDEAEKMMRTHPEMAAARLAKALMDDREKE